MVRTGRADRSRGFTLVELLVSLAVLALIALTMTAALRFVVRAVASTDQRREALEELTLGLSLLRGELQRAEPLMRTVGRQSYVMFEGGPDRLRFVHVEPPYLAGSPYTAYEYSITPDAGAWRVDVRRAAIDPDAPDLAIVETADPRTVLRLTRAVQFTYWGSRRSRDPPRWYEEWPTGTVLPQAVRLAAAEAPGWPELVAQLRVTAPWYCGTGDSGGGQAGDSGGGQARDSGRGQAEDSGRGQGGAANRSGCPGEDATQSGSTPTESGRDESLLNGGKSGLEPSRHEQTQ